MKFIAALLMAVSARPADNQFINMFKAGGEVCGIASEENDDFMAFDSEFSKNGKYVVLFDPLDGSSNIDVKFTCDKEALC